MQTLDEPRSEADLLERATIAIGERLPAAWSLARRILDRETAGGVDAVLEIEAPDATRSRWVVEIKRAIEPRDVRPVLDRLQAYARGRDATSPLLVARYLSPSVRAALTAAGASYVDATGNMRLSLDRPALYISDRGQDRDPWRSRVGRPRGTLKGAPASAVVRALTDIDEAWTVRRLVDRSEVSTGSVYRVLDYLEAEALVIRREDGRFVVPSWRQLIEAWSRDYGFLRSNIPTSCIAPRGLKDLTERVARSTGIRYAVTGSMAAKEWNEYAPTRVAAIYVDDVASAVEDWGLTRTEAGVNVVLAQPASDVVYARTVEARGRGLVLAAPTQVAADLLSGPGRNPSEGQELLGWMERNERAWRR